MALDKNRNQSFRLPWFIFDLQNFTLITSSTVPSDIKDTKNIILSETPIPGSNFQPINPAGNGNRKLSLTIPIIKRGDAIGNVLFIKQFERLRNQSKGLFSNASQQFRPNPKVLYYWGTGSVPLEYYVNKVEFTHKGDGWVGATGMPQYSDVSLGLTLDETNFLYRTEEIWRDIASELGLALGIVDTVRSQQGRATI